MKKLNIIYYCFTLSFLALLYYLDYYVYLQSFYWLIGKLVGFVIIAMGAVFIPQKNKIEFEAPKVLKIGMAILLLTFYFYHSITEYNRNVHQNKFGLVYNQIRKKLGIPEIPANWYVKFRGDRSFDWAAPDTFGHATKDIAIDSNWNIEFEDDSYNLKPQKGVSRNMDISFRYAHGKSADSIFYRYEVGDSTREISRQQADSIFAAENVKKDY